MRYTRMRDYLSRRSRDRRGYEHDYNRGGDMAGYHQYDRMGDDYGYSNSYNERGGDYAQSSRQYDRYNGGSYGEGMNRYYPVRRSGYFDYNTYGGDYASGGNFKLSPSEIRKWDRRLRERGAPFTVDQVKQIAQQKGIKFDEFSPELLTVYANMQYDHHKNSAKGDIAEHVVRAKEELCDDDFDGEPEEKAYLYYNAIVNKEDD